MANPSNAIGTNAAFGGRTSPNAFNDVMGAFQGRGILSGWACSPNSGLTVSLGGDGVSRDVAIAEDNVGNKTSVNNISSSPVNITIPAAPATQSRIDSIVVYVNNPPQGSSTITDNYGAVNILVVSGTSGSTPVAPNDSAIRTAITADGASGATVYYVVLANITISAGTTDITNNMIASGPLAKLKTSSIELAEDSVDSSVIKWSDLALKNVSIASVATIFGTISGVTMAGTISLAQNDSGNMYRVYGSINAQCTSNATKTLASIPKGTSATQLYGVDTGLIVSTAPSGSVWVDKCGFAYVEANNVFSYGSSTSFAIGSNGHIYVYVSTTSSWPYYAGDERQDEINSGALINA